jgi:hypothetical protein
VLAEAAWQRSPARAGRTAGALLAVGGWGALLAAVMILPGLELVGRSVRTQLNPAAYADVGYFLLESLHTLVQPDYYGLLSGAYVGPGDKTQHYFYAGLAMAPLAVLGVGHARALRAGLVLALPFVWYAVGPAGGLFRLLARLPGFHSVELPMNGWFLPALGLALLAGAGVSRVHDGLRRWPRLRAAILAGLLATLFADLLTFNALRNPLAYARMSFQEQYGRALDEFQQRAAGVQRLYGPPESAIGYRNHPLQSRIETTYGYNPLELLAYAEYAEAAETNPRLVAGLAVAQRLPWLLFSLVSGALVDRLDRRLLMVRVDAVRSLAVGLLGVAVLADAVSLPLLYAVFFALGTAETLFDSAAISLLPAVVPREQLPRANGRLLSARMVANELVAPPLGGLLFAAAAAVPFLLDAGTFAAAAALVAATAWGVRA